VVDPVSQMTLMGQMAVVWIDLETLQQELFNGLPMINQVLFTVDTRLDKNMTFNAADGLTERFHAMNIDVSSIEFTIYDETIDRVFFDADAGSVDKVGTIFGVIGLIVCAVAIFNTLSRVVQSQRRNIGLFMSMGSNRSIIIGHYLKITMLLASIGVFLGIPIGYLFSIGLTKLVVRFMGMTVLVFPIAYNEYILASLATLAISMFSSIFSAWPITTVTPREAMSAFFNRINTTSKNAGEKVFGWIPGFRAIYMLVPIREIFMRKKKSLVSILAITTSMIILINSVAMVSNMYSSMTDNYDKYNTADIVIKLETPVPISNINSFMANISTNGDSDIVKSELYISLYTKLSVNDEFKSWMSLECYQANSTLRNFNIIEGDSDSQTSLTKNTIILGNSIAGKYDIGVDDEIQIGTLANYSVQVTALVGELIDYTAFWTLDVFQQENLSAYFGLPTNYVNGILLDVSDDADLNTLKEIFSTSFAISQWIDADKAQESVMNLMETMMSMFFVFILVGVGIGILFSFNTMYMGFLSHENDFLAFKAMGTEPKYMRRMIFWENAILSVFSLVITIPLGYFFYWWSMDYMLGDRFYIPISVPLYTWPIVFLLSLVAIWLATNRLMKRIKNLNLADELRTRIVA
jgi:putative ABC transport system permease protein